MLYVTKSSVALAAILLATPALASDASSSYQNQTGGAPVLSHAVPASAVMAVPDFRPATRLVVGSWRTIEPTIKRTEPALDIAVEVVPTTTPEVRPAKRPKIVPGVYRTVEYNR